MTCQGKVLNSKTSLTQQRGCWGQRAHWNFITDLPTILYSGASLQRENLTFIPQQGVQNCNYRYQDLLQFLISYASETRKNILIHTPKYLTLSVFWQVQYYSLSVELQDQSADQSLTKPGIQKRFTRIHSKENGETNCKYLRISLAVSVFSSVELNFWS